MNELALAQSSNQKTDELARGLGLFDSTMFVVGAMIGSGIFIVPAEMSRNATCGGVYLYLGFLYGWTLFSAGTNVQIQAYICIQSAVW